MSEWHVEVVRIGPVEKHPNADTLSITQVWGGYPAIFRTGDFAEGDLAVYVPVDSIVPDAERWKFLDGNRRIKAKRLRGVFSMGLLTPIEPGMSEGDAVAEAMGITKYEPPPPRGFGFNSGPSEPQDPRFDPGCVPEYTDVEGWRRHKTVLVDGELVIAEEKLHGMNARYVYHDDRLFVASHHRWKDADGDSVWARVARELDLATKLAPHPDMAVYGEVYGAVQDLKYGAGPGELRFRAFDVMDCKSRKYLDHADARAFLASVGIEAMPVLYEGPWSADLVSLAEGMSTLPGANCIREGFVVRPIVERYAHMGRVVFKFVGEGYLTRKGA